METFPLYPSIPTRRAAALADCPDCGAASGHWPSCPHYPFA